MKKYDCCNSNHTYVADSTFNIWNAGNYEGPETTAELAGGFSSQHHVIDCVSGKNVMAFVIELLVVMLIVVANIYLINKLF